jgi:hypothetical protein
MWIRSLGTVMLGVGFVMLAVVVVFRDPTALDANIGAGFLVLVGVPVGTIGLLLTAGHAAYAAIVGRRQR